MSCTNKAEFYSENQGVFLSEILGELVIILNLAPLQYTELSPLRTTLTVNGASNRGAVGNRLTSVLQTRQHNRLFGSGHTDNPGDGKNLILTQTSLCLLYLKVCRRIYGTL
ncbi:hypothetical protein GDO81_024964 [Engystomops pustulosus]|uniref:Uncharacterized protein n=1 Tax=Engystomops pustulosus TaxID=76066 RepID=A0AAV6YJ64_ENGPU|nr:hypothetical protein GDO81_024964 [Engystomops pustulosus]